MDLPFGEGDLKVFADLLLQLSLQIGHVAAKSCYLVDGSIRPEVGHKLYDGLQQLRTLSIVPRFAQSP